MILEHSKVENELISSVEEIRKQLKLELIVTKDTVPGKCGIQNMILFTIMGRIGMRAVRQFFK